MKVFFYGICGMGMGAAAVLLQEAGLEVEGGDVKFAPPMGTYLKSKNIPLHLLCEVNDQYISSFDLIVVGNVISKNSPNAQRLENLEVEQISFPAALKKFVLDNKRVVGVAGTHGKTTTTFFLAQVFEKLGESAGHFIGGVLNERDSAVLGSGEQFFIEADEYDSAYFEKISKFRLYNMKNLILTSLEFDHADIFQSIEDIKDQFREILKDIQSPIVFCSDYSACQDLQKEFSSKEWIAYGSDTPTGPFIVKSGPEGSLFELSLNNVRETFETNIMGLHNIYNLTAVILYAHTQHYPIEKIRQAVKHLTMAKRRQEIRGMYKGSVVIDDFAHHPQAVKITLEMIKSRYPDKHVHVIMEPCSATARSSLFQKTFEDSLQTADSLTLIRPSVPTTVSGIDNLDVELIAANLVAPATVVDTLSELISELDSIASPKKVVLVVSNGNVLGLWPQIFGTANDQV